MGEQNEEMGGEEGGVWAGRSRVGWTEARRWESQVTVG